MARTKKRRATSRALVRVGAKPVVIRTTRVVKAKKKGHRRSRSMLGGFLSERQIAAGIGGGVLGLIKKNFPNLPHLPYLGQNGTVAIAAHLFRGKLPYAENVAEAALTLALYQLATEGKIEGGYVAGGYVAGF
jgi:hypothetical protein